MLEIISALSGAAVALIGLISVTAANPRFRSIIVTRLVNGLKGKQVITVADLRKHELVAKLLKFQGTGVILSTLGVQFPQPKKNMLFEDYMKIICKVYQESITRILLAEFEDLDEAGLRILLIQESTLRIIAEAELFRLHLLTLNNDVEATKTILYKLQSWKQTENLLIEANIEAVVSTNRLKCVEYKLDIIFNLYSLGLDFLLKNGAESFNKLNGDLNNYLGNETSGGLIINNT
jgi:hypothetical protein